uniref:Uncharacterized protein n=1 Tax=Tanacetum cinerariifolium TaxID=118510 RepID=A0A6L2KKM2_TANCI|nr:hypothetical protein [Tanacetum cinerariifolium]
MANTNWQLLFFMNRSTILSFHRLNHRPRHLTQTICLMLSCLFNISEIPLFVVMSPKKTPLYLIGGSKYTSEISHHSVCSGGVTKNQQHSADTPSANNTYEPSIKN